MKIGIMSMQCVANYGSFLQAYGLKKEIEKLGHQVEFVDYQVEPSLVKDEPDVKARNWSNKIKRALRMLSFEYRQYRKKQIRMNRTFAEFQTQYYNSFLPMLKVTEVKNYLPELDALVIGSDEVFNCTQKGKMVGYSPQLFGKDNRAGKLLSYAASFGTTTMRKLQYYGIEKEVEKLLKEFDALSVRDDNSASIINLLCGEKPCKNIDPVLLYDFPEVDDIHIDMKDYIVVYAYADRIKADEARGIRKFAQEKNKKLVTLGFCQPFADEYILTEPVNVLAYIKNAAYVITDTFHGTVFSIKYQVPFGTIIRESNRQKLGDLLDMFDLRSREIRNIEEISAVLEMQIEKEKIKSLIKKEQEKARAYLSSNL